MASKKTKADPFPFAFLRDGPWNAGDYKQSVDWLVVFEREVPEAERAALVSSVPWPLGLRTWAGGRVLSLSSGQDAGQGIWEAYSGRGPLLEYAEDVDFVLTTEHIQAFCDEVDRWLVEAHRNHRLGLVVGTTDRQDKWHRWSVEQFSEQLLPMFEAFFATARPQAEEIRNVPTAESGMAFALAGATRNYFSKHEMNDAPDEMLSRLSNLIDRATGYSLTPDYLLGAMKGHLSRRLGRS